ncbi:MAG: hypothetical protein IT289_06255 [Oligoflexia bacterium]|nr:hypothetical protein [Oligoflexia bacterium]
MKSFVIGTIAISFFFTSALAVEPTKRFPTQTDEDLPSLTPTGDESDYTEPKQDPSDRVEPTKDFDAGNAPIKVEVIDGVSSSQPKVDQKLRSGAVVYKTKQSPIKGLAGVRIAPYNPTRLDGDTAGIDYETIYKRGTILATFDYEFYLFRNFGKFGIKPSIGMFAASGNGRFKNNVTVEAEEKISLYGFPMTASAVYHLQIWDRQFLVPYAEAGISYIGFAEHRPDKSGLSAFKFGGAPAWSWAAGGQIQLDFLDKAGVWQLDTEYGINHIYLVAGVRQVIGLSTRFDFTTLLYEGGVWFEF